MTHPKINTIKLLELLNYGSSRISFSLIKRQDRFISKLYGGLLEDMWLSEQVKIRLDFDSYYIL